MPPVSSQKLREMYCDVMNWTVRAEEAESLSSMAASDEIKKAYNVIYCDFMWKVRRSINEIWLYTNSIEGLGEFLPPPSPKSQTDASSVDTLHSESSVPAQTPLTDK